MLILGRMFAIAAAIVAAAAPAELPARLTLPEALRIFRERGFDLLLAEAQVESAKADELAAGAVPNPSLSGSLGRSFNYDPSQCSGCSALQIGLGVSENGALADTLWGKRSLRIEAAARAVAAAKMTRADAQRTLEFQLKQLYLQAVQARAQLDFSAETEATYARTQELNRKRLELGAISDADLAKIDVAAMEAQQARDQAAQALRAARAQLALLLGVRSALPGFEVDAAILESRQVTEPKRDEVLEEAKKHRPDLLALDRQIERAQRALELARRQRWPDPQLSLNYSQEGSGQNAISPPTLTLGVSVPIPIFYRQSGEIAKAVADLKTQELQRKKVEAQVASDVETALGQLDTMKKLVARMRGGLLARAKRARDLVEVQYQKGAASLLDLLDAERTYIGTHGEYLADLAGYWIAVAQLEQAAALELAP